MTYHKPYTLLLIPLLFIASCVPKKKEPAAVDQHASMHKDMYTCPMHPEVVSDTPGVCPKCHMDLEKVTPQDENKTDISLDDLLAPTNKVVISSVPVTSIQKQHQNIEIKALGKVTYDTREEKSISARVSGRIEKLYVRYRYQHVHAGQKIMEIYSPEIATAQQNLLLLIKRDTDNKLLIDAAKQKLLLLGMSTEQLQSIIDNKKPDPTISVYSNYTGHIHESGAPMAAANTGAMKDVSLLTEELPLKEGAYVEKGQTIFSIYNTDKAWVLLNIYADDQHLVKKGNKVVITAETAPDKKIVGEINFIEPFYSNTQKTLTARVYFTNSNLQIPVGSSVRAVIQADTENAYWLSRDAVVSLGLNKIVFVKTGAGFKARKIVTGITYNDRVQILSGITQEDEIASNAQFLMDSESFIKE
ncbi:efflux RND transporter periplasmic adaptor subunit [Chitinophagaceae bacterium LWZ2-11]